MRAGKVLQMLYLWAVVVGGGILLVRLFPQVDLDFSVELAVLILVVMVAEWLVVFFPRGQLSSGYAVTFGTFLLFGPAAAAWVSALGIMFGQGIVNRGNPVRIILFNSAQSVLAVCGAYWAYRLSGGVAYPGELLALVNILPLLIFSGTYFLINHLLIYLYLLPGRRIDPGGWRGTFVWSASTYLFLVPLGFLAAVVYQAAGLVGVLPVLLLGLVIQFFLRRHIMVEMNNREMGILYEVARRLGTDSDPGDLLDLILRETRQLVPCHTAAVYLWSEERRLFEPAAINSRYASELNDIVWEQGEGIVGWAAQAKEACLIADTRNDLRLDRELGLSQFLRSMILIPLLSGDEVLGVFVIADRHPDVYHERMLHILTIVGGQVAMAVDNARLRRRLEKQAGSDCLTGLPSRYRFWQWLQSELIRTRRQDRLLAVVILAVKGLQDFNRRFGFAVGDNALVQIARVLEGRVGSKGTAARYGGDKFALLLPDAGEIRATETAEQLQEAVGQISFGVEGREGRDERVRLSVQFGLAVSPLDGSTADELLMRAEGELYRSGERMDTGVLWAGGG